jgi:hypothetical protein
MGSFSNSLVLKQKMSPHDSVPIIFNVQPSQYPHKNEGFVDGIEGGGRRGDLFNV